MKQIMSMVVQKLILLNLFLTLWLSTLNNCVQVIHVQSMLLQNNGKKSSAKQIIALTSLDKTLLLSYYFFVVDTHYISWMFKEGHVIKHNCWKADEKYKTSFDMK